MSASKYLIAGIITGILVSAIHILFSISFLSFISSILFGEEVTSFIENTIISEVSMPFTDRLIVLWAFIVTVMFKFTVLSAIVSLFLFYLYDKIPGKNLKMKIIILPFCLYFTIFLLSLLSVLFLKFAIVDIPNVDNASLPQIEIVILLGPITILWKIILIIIYAYLFNFVLKKLLEQNIRQTMPAKNQKHS